MSRDVTNELDRLSEVKIQAHISNISFPKSIDELEFYMYEHGCFNIEDILNRDASGWTVPRNSRIGDIVLFFHAKTAIQWIRKLETQVRNMSQFDAAHNKTLLLEWLQKARKLYGLYGGKIFAIGRVISNTFYDDENIDPILHWGNRIYADITDVVILENPIDISEFRDYLKISRQSGITMIPYKEFEQLKSLIISKNENIPNYFRKSIIGNLALIHINSDNFLTVTKEYRRRFLLEAEFRSYYVDFLLKFLFGKSVYSECTCHTNNSKVMYYVDNVFVNNDKYLMLEIKLNIDNEKNLVSQLEQYTNSIRMDLTKKRSIDNYERNYMYVIDTRYIYKYLHKTKTFYKLVNLDNLGTMDDLIELKEKFI